MNEKMNAPAKWLQYLLYVSIASLVNAILVNIPLLGSLSRWVGLALSAAVAYLLFQLKDANPRYQNAAICSLVALIGSLIGGTILSLVGSICGIVAQYQEYHAHGELVEERDSKLADKWGSLFWIQFAVSIIVTLLSSVIAAALVAGGGMEMTTAASIVTVVVSVVTLLLKALYLVYLNRTIHLTENEFVVEGVKES